MLVANAKTTENRRVMREERFILIFVAGAGRVNGDGSFLEWYELLNLSIPCCLETR